MELKLRQFELDGDIFQLIGFLDKEDKPRFHIRVDDDLLLYIRPEEMNVLVNRMQDELYDMKIPEPVKCEDGSTYCFARDSVIERFMKDNAEEVQGDDRAQEGTEGR